jgi:predicted phage terminase large subunit-like protein
MDLRHHWYSSLVALVPRYRVFRLAKAMETGEAPGLAYNPGAIYRVPIMTGLGIALVPPRPARLDDNPFINRVDYTKSLLNLDPVTRARILNGDWEARSMRGVIKRERFEVVDILPSKLSIVRYWDTAYQKRSTSDYTVGVKYGIDRDGIAYIIHVARAKASPHEVESLIANTASKDGRSICIVLQQEPGSGSALWIDSMHRGALRGYPVYRDQVKGSKFERSQPFRSAAEARHIKLLRGAWNDDFLEECEQFSPDEREYAHDDQVDAACGAFNFLKAPQPFEYIRVPRRSLATSNDDDQNAPYERPDRKGLRRW